MRILLTLIAYTVIISLLIKWKTGLTVGIVKYVFIVLACLSLGIVMFFGMGGETGFDALIGNCKTGKHKQTAQEQVNEKTR